jgi:copper homeostasis protein
MFHSPAVPIALEVIATSLADALAAEAGGAARIELVRDLDRGGLTPGPDLLDAVLDAVRIPVRVMVRETESHVVDDPARRAQLAAEARAIGRRRVDGVVFGAVTGGDIDLRLLDLIADACGRPVTFHRAFEALADPDAAVDRLAAHPAVDLILCDGGAGEWVARAARIASWTRRGAGGVRVMPGGGVTAEALAVLAGVPEVRDLHVGRLARRPVTDGGEVSVAAVASIVGQLAAVRFR